MKKDSQIMLVVTITIIISVILGYMIFERILFKQQTNESDESNDFYQIDTIYGPYEIEINRNYHNESEEELIIIAENITPQDGNWQVDEVDNIIITDCVNIDAINYYVGLIEIIRTDHDLTGFDIKRARFTYNANVKYIKNNGEYNTTDEDLIEVNLTISFSENCDSQCAMGFEHYRCVIFNAQKEIISVSGDDIRPLVWVS